VFFAAFCHACCKERFAINLEWNGVPTLYVVHISPEARELFTAGNAVCTLGAWIMFRGSLTTSPTLVDILQVYVHIVWTEGECLTQGYSAFVEPYGYGRMS
jgi:hypothetical protein